MEIISLFFGFAAMCAVLAGPFLLVLSPLLGKEGFIAAMVMIVAGNAICIGGYGMEPVFYLKWIGF